MEVFRLRSRPTEVKALDLRLSPRHYQATCVFHVLTSPVREGVVGELLADDMRLGKTLASLAVVVRRRLLQDYNHFKRYPDIFRPLV